MMAFFRCWVLQRPARAARFRFSFTGPPFRSVSIPSSVCSAGRASNGAATRARVRVTERAHGEPERVRIGPCVRPAPAVPPSSWPPAWPSLTVVLGRGGARSRRPSVHPRAPRRVARVRQAHVPREHAAGLPPRRVAGLRAGAGREAHERPRAGGDPRRHARPDHPLHRQRGRPHVRPAPRRLSLGHPRDQRQLRAARARRPPPRPDPEALRGARAGQGEGRAANLEIKNLPTDPDFDATRAYATTVVDAIEAAASPPPDRPVVLPAEPECGEEPPSGRGDELPHPGSGPRLDRRGPRERVRVGLTAVAAHPEYVPKAHSAGLRVVPFTIDTAADVAAATRAGVDELITNDPLLARRTEAPVEGPSPRIPPPPSERLRAPRGPAGAWHHRGPGPAPQGLRVFAMQLKQEARHVETYASFRTKIECMIRARVLPRLVHGAPNVVAFNEDIGLMTLATGSRGAEARKLAVRPAVDLPRPGLPLRDGALLQLSAGTYSTQVRAYQGALPRPCAASSRVHRRTDTFAPRVDAGVLGHGQALRHLHPRLERPGAVPGVGRSHRDRPLPGSRPPAADSSVYVATGPKVYNEAFLWAPCYARAEGPRPLRNVVQQNRKVPLTDIEQSRCRSRPGPPRGAGRRREPAAVPPPRHRRAPRLRHEPARLRLRRPAGAAWTLLGHQPSTTCAVWTAWAPTW